MGGEKFQKLQSDPPPTIKHKRVYRLDFLDLDISEQTLMDPKVFIRERGRYNVLIPHIVIS